MRTHFSSPAFIPASVTVTPARTQAPPPAGIPESQSIPLGTSTAKTDAPDPLIHSMHSPTAPATARATPVPRSASITTSLARTASTSAASQRCICIPIFAHTRALIPASPVYASTVRVITTRTSQPRFTSSRATANPSPPLFPGPHTTTRPPRIPIPIQNHLLDRPRRVLHQNNPRDPILLNAHPVQLPRSLPRQHPHPIAIQYQSAAHDSYRIRYR